jgi:tetratricopeptide (TPR) repeat protein
MTSEELFCEKCGAANAPLARFCQHCASPLPVTRVTGALPEQTLLISRYQLVSRIGQGGMGAVYKASDTRLDNRLVAIKEMSKAGLPATLLEEAEAAFEREARLLGKLLHPNLPRIHDHFTENDRSYLVMDFIDGETLEEYLDNKGHVPLPTEQVVNWAEQLCDVLSYLHNHQPPIIFRDLKPANVMISESGHIFLIDFGIARIFKPGQSHDTVALGSPGYAAPEQYGKAQSTPRSDLYSLGALTHCLLTGDDPSERPFFFRPASQLNPAVPSGLSALLQRMLEMDAERRPASAQEVLQSLRSGDSTYQRQQGMGSQQTMSVPRISYSYGATNSSPSPTPSGVDLLLEEAHSLYTQKRLTEAEKVYTQALQLNNTNPLGWQGRGLTQGLLARHTEALTSFEKALQLDPALVISWNGKGTALSTLQHNQDALSAFERALKLDPNNASSWNGKGAVLNALGRPKEALDAFDMALRFDPHMAQAWNNKGLVLRHQKRFQEALSAFDKALSFDKNIATSWSGKASVLADMGKLQEALDCYQQACNCNPALVSAWNGKGSVLYDMGRYKQALQAFQEALRLDKNYAPACYGTGNIYYVQQKLKSALEMFDRALRYDPNYAKAWNRRGNVLSDLGERVEALKSYDRALRVDARFASAWNGKAGVYAQLERYTEALHAYEMALRINPNFAQAWNGQGNTFYHLNKYNQALTSYERALKLNPQMASAWHNLSLVLKKLKRNKEALEAAEQAIRLAPNDPDNWTRKAEALKSMRRSRDAKEAEKQAGKLRGAVR